MTKRLEQVEARRLRRQGVSMKGIAERLGVSPGSVHLWTSDIDLPAGIATRATEGNVRRALACSETARIRRRRFQADGASRARRLEPLHMAGCLLYWAEGSKGQNTLIFCNSDLNMVRYFVAFLRECFGLTHSDMTLSINVYLGNGVPLCAVERHWLNGLGLQRECLRKGTVNHFPTSSSGKRTNKLTFGVCTLKVRRSTWLVQHIFGAIQEYASFQEPRWLG